MIPRAGTAGGLVGVALRPQSDTAARLPQNAKPGSLAALPGFIRHADGDVGSLGGDRRLECGPRRSPDGWELPGLPHPALPLVVLDPEHHSVVTALLAGPVDHVYAGVEAEPRHLGRPECVRPLLSAPPARQVDRLGPIALPPGQRVWVEPLVQLVALQELLDVRRHSTPPGQLRVRVAAKLRVRVSPVKILVCHRRDIARPPRTFSSGTRNSRAAAGPTPGLRDPATARDGTGRSPPTA